MRVGDLIARAGVKHPDETGFRISSKTQWLHVLRTPWLTCRRTDAKRGYVWQGLAGCLVHDRRGPYFKLREVVHGRCNARHLRELRARVDVSGEDWVRRMQQRRRANGAAGIAREQGVQLPRSLLERIRRRYDRLLAEGLACHRRWIWGGGGARSGGPGTT